MTNYITTPLLFELSLDYPPVLHYSEGKDFGNNYFGPQKDFCLMNI